jgi:hypothetical protein
MKSRSNNEPPSLLATAIEAKDATMRFYVAGLVSLILAIESPAATGEKTSTSGSESLGGRLLEDLSPNAGSPAAMPQAVERPKDTKEIEDSLEASTPLRGFGAAASPTSQSLARVQIGMLQAQSLLTQPAGDGSPAAPKLASPVQNAIISDLDKLIADLSKKCQSCNGQCNQPPKPGQNSKPGKPGAAGSGRTAARDSTDRLNSSSAKPVDKGEVNEMVKALWGHLPERSRQQMLQSFSHEFLPKYELEIEQYYRRLSEEQGESQAK